MARVLLADDHVPLLGAFEKLLSGECNIVGQVSDGRSLVEAAERLKPDVIVLDISMKQIKVKTTAELIQYAVRHHIV
jgi:DNA-binding NarL/FixJ family response regulator